VTSNEPLKKSLHDILETLPGGGIVQVLTHVLLFCLLMFSIIFCSSVLGLDPLCIFIEVKIVVQL
jgi:hypothetical protein